MLLALTESPAARSTVTSPDIVFASMGPAASASVMLPLAEERSAFDATRPNRTFPLAVCFRVRVRGGHVTRRGLHVDHAELAGQGEVRRRGGCVERRAQRGDDPDPDLAAAGEHLPEALVVRHLDADLVASRLLPALDLRRVDQRLGVARHGLELDGGGLALLCLQLDCAGRQAEVEADVVWGLVGVHWCSSRGAGRSALAEAA
jgi:hypothetical protein